MEPCRRCLSAGRTTPAHTLTYWNDWLCRACVQAIAALLDERDAWPPVPWNDDDEAVIG